MYPPPSPGSLFFTLHPGLVENPPSEDGAPSFPPLSDAAPTERWGSSAEAVADVALWGAGPRACLAVAFGSTFVNALVASVLKHYAVSAPEQVGLLHPHPYPTPTPP